MEKVTQSIPGNQAKTADYDDDWLKGGDGDDELYGRDGNDRLNGGNGNDHLCAGDGNDILYSSNGQDYLHGESGSDIFILASEGKSLASADVVAYFDNLDSLNIRSVSKLYWGYNESSTILLDMSGDVLAVLAGERKKGYFRRPDLETWRSEAEERPSFPGFRAEPLYISTDVPDFWYWEFVNINKNDFITTAAELHLEEITAGTRGNDNLTGASTTQRVFGFEGGDVLTGGICGHTLIGGAGADKFTLGGTKTFFDVVTDFNPGEGDKLRIDLDEADITAITAKTGRAEKLSALADAAEIRWGLGSYFSQTSATNDNTKQETLIYDTKGTASLRDDVTIMVLEDFTDDLTWAMFEIA